MKKLLLFLLLFVTITVLGQGFNNEWIRYDQTYYKFKVGSNGLYRISKSVLDAAGVNTSQVENLELWRNGVKEPLYTSVSTGALPVNGYIEFWGRMNDGVPDQPLYRTASDQHSTALNLIYDTAYYFLSVNTNQSGFRATTQSNNVAAPTIPVEPYFMYKAGNYFKSQLNKGFAAVIGEYVYSSSYDKGEFWCSSNITPAAPLTTNLSNLMVYSSGPAASLRYGLVGVALNARNVRISVNNTQLVDTVMDYFNDVNAEVSVPISLLNTGSAAVKLTNTSLVSSDRMVSSYFELTYPRQFDFGGSANFEFVLPADNDGYYLEITNFNHGGVQPVLYDLTTGARYLGDIAVAGKTRFLLPAAPQARKFALASTVTGNVNQITNLTPRTFVNYALIAQQADFMIISNPLLFTSSTGRNYVDDYRAYRSSANGGGFNAKVFDINELGDQFAFGMAKHPLAVRNFILYARARFATLPKFVFIIGRGMVYNEYRAHFSEAVVDQLNLVPTFGSPGSDNLFSVENLQYPVAKTPIGRLSVVSASEIQDYLEKIVEYETVQRTSPNTIAGRAWMKNFVHVTGASDPYLGEILCNYVAAYKQVIADTLMGGRVYTFCKVTANPEEKLSSDKIGILFNEGISSLTYFGHSSATTLEFNIDNPQNYSNAGKYPLFFVNGCNAGNFFTYYPQRLVANETLSEKFVLAKQRGSIAFVASTHFGIVNYLNIYLGKLYENIGRKMYGRSLGEMMQTSLSEMLDITGSFDYYARMHAEEITIHGDPAIKFNQQLKPDYVVEEPMIVINPSFISVAETSFKLKVLINNLGKATADSLQLQVKRQYPDGKIETIIDKKIKNIVAIDSLSFDIPIISTRDKGTNKIIVTLDPLNAIDEIAENNNTATKEFIVYEDEARPVLPLQFAIVSNASQKLYVSTANPLGGTKNYLFEIDTTEQFNSIAKVSKTFASSGGVIEINPGFTFLNNTVYYWRIAPIPAQGSAYYWNTSSFIYIKDGGDGFNQSHFYQYNKNTFDRMQLDSLSRQLKYGYRLNTVYIKNALYPYSGTADADFTVSLNDQYYLRSACLGNSLIFHVIDPVKFLPWKNVDSLGNNLYRFGSASANCQPTRNYNFEFSYMTAASRKVIMNFLDSIPNGYYVVIRSIDAQVPNSYSATWRADTTLYGSNNSLYHKLLAIGFTQIDSLNKRQPWVGVYKKGDKVTMPPVFKFTGSMYEVASLTADCKTPDTIGYMHSQKFGPAKSWKSASWAGHDMESPTADNLTVSVIGVSPNNVETELYKINQNNAQFDISAVNAVQYPYIKLAMRNLDSTNLTPYQLDYWRLKYDPVPEGALAPNLAFSMKDTFDVGEPIQFSVAFKNISSTPFDSLKLKSYILDKFNVQHPVVLRRTKPLVASDTSMIRFSVVSTPYVGANTLYLEVNADKEQPEQTFFNNVLFKNFFVKPDLTNPLLDVTFDGVHIMNKDLVSSKPHIVVKLKDESKFMLLQDTSLVNVQLRYPNGQLRTFRIDQDTLRFTPAVSGTDNAATLDFNPQFLQQLDPAGDEYELIVKGKDQSGNKAGELEYRVVFKVITKSMISNLLNYPNPFSTATAFVFTLTGSEIPQQFKIQILTVTGKVVKEITKGELGSIHIGRNITEYKWDGTDMFGQKLANGVYLYRVVTSLNGKKMEKYTAEGDPTQQYFNNGYGKMYLMR